MSDDTDQPIVERVDRFVVDRPLLVVAAFLVVSAALAPGLTMISTQAETDQFTEDVEAQQAQENIEEEFGTSIGNAPTSGTLILQDSNVLSRPTLVRILETQHRLETNSRLRIASTTSHASGIARQLDPSAETPLEQRRAVEAATDGELRAAIDAADERGLGAQLSTDYNPNAQRATGSIVGITYDLPASASTAEVATLQERTIDVIDSVEGNEAGDNAILFGQGVIQNEFNALLTDTAIIVFPATVIFLFGFLLLAYRDPVDMFLGLGSLAVVLVWTFGVMGWAGIPFSNTMVPLFPLLLAVGIDFGIHTINRYREATLAGDDIAPAMRKTTDQLLVAFAIVTITTAISFAANLTSPLGSLQDFGIVSAIGIVITFVVFGLFLPATKVLADRARARIPYFPEFGSTPLGSEGSLMGRVLESSVSLARIAPAVVVVVAVVGGGGAAVYGTGVDAEFSQEIFFPDEDRVEAYQALPEPLAPTEYTFTKTIRLFEEEFGARQFSTVTIYVDESVRDDDSLEILHRATRQPPDSFQRAADGDAQASSIVTVIQSRADRDPEFAALVARNDRTGNGVPDQNVDQVYDALLDSPARSQARNYIAADRGSARIDFTLKSDATDDEIVADARRIADRMPVDAVATGTLIVNAAVIDVILESAIQSLAVAFVLTAVFLALSYRFLEGRAVYGFLNLLPVLVTVALLAASMRFFGIALSPINAPILGVSIGLGVDYAVHFMHRFVDEYTPGTDVFDALRTTIQGTGGALTGSMLTTVFGLGALFFAIIPLIQEFGLLLGLGVFYAYACSVLLLPSIIVVWERAATRSERVPTLASP
ncbi:efflux RND transporter permease subunit [Natronomonas marina]|jgi:predicted RND superfamily exporter protein|uniref:efflux RND transporter permease subunit n=1 Tax=Natronomonas marina TaxID=2961939 RepID=UPI0020C95B24|nr:MMPL family transporter [Natronomonas marina]